MQTSITITLLPEEEGKESLINSKIAAQLKRTAAGAEEKILEEINKDVSAVNKNLQPYQRITRVTILFQPLEMTTTQKVKRNYK